MTTSGVYLAPKQLRHPRCSSPDPNCHGTRGCDGHPLAIQFPQNVFVAYALPEWWAVTVCSGSICLFCFKGSPPPSPPLKFRLPSLRPLADCLPAEFCQQLDTKYIYRQFYICQQLPPFSFLLFMHYCFFSHPSVGRRDAAFLLQKWPISFGSLSFSFLLVSFSFVSFPFFSTYNEADSVTSGLVRIYLLRPR